MPLLGPETRVILATQGFTLHETPPRRMTIPEILTNPYGLLHDISYSYINLRCIRHPDQLITLSRAGEYWRCFATYGENGCLLFDGANRACALDDDGSIAPVNHNLGDFTCCLAWYQSALYAIQASGHRSDGKHFGAACDRAARFARRRIAPLADTRPGSFWDNMLFCLEDWLGGFTPSITDYIQDGRA